MSMTLEDILANKDLSPRRPKMIDGSLVTRTVSVPLNRVLLNFDGLPDSEKVAQVLQKGDRGDFVRIILLDNEGKPFKEEDQYAVPTSFRFRVEGKGIDPQSVKSVTFPTLDYGGSMGAFIKIELIVWEDEFDA